MAEPMPVSEARFRHVLGHLAGGVAVVTSRERDGAPCGLTATAVCSVSLDPPLVLVSVDQSSRTHRGIEGSRLYAVNLLSLEQQELAARFAGKEPDKFRGLETREEITGAPILEGTLGFLDCTVDREVPAGDHTLFIGRVEEARITGDEVGEPLVYHLGRYGTVVGE